VELGDIGMEATRQEILTNYAFQGAIEALKNDLKVSKEKLALLQEKRRQIEIALENDSNEITELEMQITKRKKENQ
jgi:hypothetical protein